MWKPVKGYEGLYEVSDQGLVKSLGNDKILKPTVNHAGYLYVNLYKGGKCKHYFVHRLVANAFIPNDNETYQINHKDENKTNNDISNLEWVSPKYNTNYGTGQTRRATKRKIPVINMDTGMIFNSATDAEIYSGVDRSNIGSCCKNIRTTAGGYHWQYVN